MSADTPAIRAEQALLGAILADEQARATDPAARRRPRMLDEVAVWVQPGDFRRPYHRQVWDALLTLRRRREVATPQAVRAELSRDSQLRTETAHDGLLLHELMTRAPVASRAPLYAGMVVEASLHRDLHTEAIRLEQGTSSADPEQVLSAQAHARARLGVLRQRWERVPPAVRVQLDRPASAEAAAASPVELRAQARELAAQLEETRERVARQRAAGRAPAAADLSLIELLAEMLGRIVSMIDGLANASVEARRSPAPDGRVVLTPGQSLAGAWRSSFVEPEAEALARGPEQAPRGADSTRAQRAAIEGRLLGSIIADPSQLDDLALSSDMLTDPDVRQMFQAAVDIHRGAGMVDEMTIEWAVQRAGGDLSAIRDEVRAGMTAGVPGQAASLAADIAAAAARDRSAQAAQALRQTAADPRIPPARMLAVAEAELADLPEPKLRPRPGPQRPSPARPRPTPADRQPPRRVPEREPEPVPERQPATRQPQRGPELHRYRRRPRRRPAEREHELEL